MIGGLGGGSEEQESAVEPAGGFYTRKKSDPTGELDKTARGSVDLYESNKHWGAVPPHSIPCTF